MNYPIYMDYNATTPCLEEVVQAMLPFFSQHFGNAASKSHAYGWMAENAIENAREQVADLIGAKSKEIIFTSGATEAINLAIKGIFEVFKGKKQHYITCQTEHKAVLDTFKSLEKEGAEISYLPVNQYGEIDLEEVMSSIQEHTKMIALMWGNNETGLIHPMDDIIRIANEKNIILLTDAVQTVGKIPVNVSGIHMMAFSSHKFYGPKGVGALYIRHNHPLPKPFPLIVGGGHEKGYRSGTLNVPGIVGMGKAAEIQQKSIESDLDRLLLLRNKLEINLLKISGTKLNGSQKKRLPHVTNISFEGVEGEELLRAVNKKVAVSSGSACTSISPKPSHVLSAMGLDSDLGRASIRFSLGKFSTEKEIENCVSHVQQVIQELRNKS
ncbi:cysteine desulfurase family protein [Cecembia rubra]|uniref:cysteine desulfurase family protein n=1 Tax=Cecembia rubra TaxID=1485585 RepID=UPI002714D953|nr:cysteine desulfurase family protein [Cecembia rubra]